MIFGETLQNTSVALQHSGERRSGARQRKQPRLAGGLAWVFDRYSEGYGDLYPLLRGAKADRRGLWTDPDPVAPWDWRQQRRSTPQP